MIIQTPWIERKFEFNFPAELFPVILERLRGALPRVKDLLGQLSEEQGSINVNGKWSVKQHVGHLYDLEDLWFARINDFLEKKEVLLAADMTNARTHSASHNDRAFAELLSQFRSARERLIKSVESLDGSVIARTALHPRLNKQIRMVDSLYFVAEHDDHHLAKIRELIG